MVKLERPILIVLMCVFVSAMASVAFARAPDGETIAMPAPAPLATPLAYPKLEADFSIYNWRRSDTPHDLVGTMTVYPSGGNGRYTYEFIGLRDTNTFDFRWRECSVLVNSLRVWSGDGQQIDVPVWRDNLPCPKHGRHHHHDDDDEEDE